MFFSRGVSHFVWIHFSKVIVVRDEVSDKIFPVEFGFGGVYLSYFSQATSQGGVGETSDSLLLL